MKITWRLRQFNSKFEDKIIAGPWVVYGKVIHGRPNMVTLRTFLFSRLASENPGTCKSHHFQNK